MHRHAPFRRLVLGLVLVFFAACSEDSDTLQSFSLAVTLQGGGAVTLATGDAAPDRVYEADFARGLPAGTLVTLTAQPADGFSFGSWGGDCDSDSPTCTFTLDTTKQVSLSFRANTESPPPPPAEDSTLTVTKAGDGAGTVTSSPGDIDCGATCQTTYIEGTTVTLTAAAEAGSSFAGWEGACQTTEPNCAVEVSGDSQVTAVFDTVTDTETVTVSTGLARGSDDAEEYLGDYCSSALNRCVVENEVEISSPTRSDDIDFGKDNIFRVNVLVGLRFTDLDIPADAVITEARIQFQIDHGDSGPTSVTFQTQADAQAPTFVEALSNISSRATGAASVEWQIEPWPGGDENEGRTGFPGALTPDLAALVQEVVDRPEWESGDNALVFLFSGEGQRQATSFEDSNNPSGQNTQLTVTYQVP